MPSDTGLELVMTLHVLQRVDMSSIRLLFLIFE